MHCSHTVGRHPKINAPNGVNVISVNTGIFPRYFAVEFDDKRDSTHSTKIFFEFRCYLRTGVMCVSSAKRLTLQRRCIVTPKLPSVARQAIEHKIFRCIPMFLVRDTTPLAMAIIWPVAMYLYVWNKAFSHHPAEASYFFFFKKPPPPSGGAPMWGGAPGFFRGGFFSAFAESHITEL